VRPRRRDAGSRDRPGLGCEAEDEVGIDRDRGQQRGAVEATCKRGSEAVSGGFETPGFDPDYVDGSIWQIDSKRDGKRKWTERGHNYGNGTGELVAYAYCDADKPRLKAKTGQATLVGPDEAGSASAKCKKGSEAVSGGVEIPDFEEFGTEILLGDSRRQGKRKWTVRAGNYGATEGSFVAIVYCDKSEPSLKSQSKSTTVDPYPDTSAVTAKCKRGSQAVSGGFRTDFDPGYEEAVIAALASKRQGKRKWTGTGYTDNLDGSGEFVVYAYCEKKK
jgi:hypothetical protein